jgi:hypothetical protein
MFRPIQYPFQLGLDAQQVAALAVPIVPVASAATKNALISILEFALIVILLELKLSCHHLFGKPLFYRRGNRERIAVEVLSSG